ncbi:Panacea domain-containing protein [Rossellomorea sp. NPDC077527]|uniref:Panacea domain-containing protein n=1 Tax=Rossellomorea sp. NPDC077527 TaxID=3364510 RepID=UPI0037C9FED2
MSRSATDLAKYFIKNNYDYPRNTFDGNMKLQKMLYFSQLIHMARKGERLFSDNMYAFKNGTVIDNVRQVYQHNNDFLVIEALNFNTDFDEVELESIKLAEKVFGHLDAATLSDLNHQQYSWQVSYENSKDTYSSYHHKERSIIDEEVIRKYDLNKISDILAVISEEDSSEEYEIVNGIKFYYDPESISIDENLLETLQSFHGDEEAYSICFDEDNGYMIY